MPGLGRQRRRTLTRVLRENGLAEIPGRGKGSHAVYEHPGDPKRKTTVPSDDVIGVHMVKLIIAQSGKTVGEYLSHLK